MRPATCISSRTATFAPRGAYLLVSGQVIVDERLFRVQGVSGAVCRMGARQRVSEQDTTPFDDLRAPPGNELRPNG
ncbi:hypothetical protein DCW30_21605 [Streptomyces alfalfae]|nr:hypothetical protein ADL30_34695 [Streptomyces sp. NRRL S-1521]RXX41004.1 hypothetical protein DCW30_21605 [Streptomyces alfalfae]RZN03187.1 hypothetical protein D4104_05125 [Streptomyces alfalfae]